jgi:signal transduction histidine kinase
LLFGSAHPDVHAVFVSEADEDERPLLAADRTRTILRVPLALGDEMLGGVAVSLPIERHFLPEDLKRVQSLVHYITLIVRLKQLSGQAGERAVLEERNRMAREIHDSLAQSLTGITLHLRAAEEAGGKRPTRSLKHLQLARRLSREALADARRSVWALHPHALEQIGLPGALKQLARTLFGETRVQVRFRSRGSASPLAGETEIQLLRIAQEAMTNVLKHARATVLRLDVSASPAGLRISVADNGRGFLLEATNGKTTAGFGLKSMRERARRAGAALKIESIPGRGTRVEIQRSTIAATNEETDKTKSHSHSARR